MASSSAFPTLRELGSFRQRASGPIVPLRSSAWTAAPLRPASLEAERPLPPNLRNRPEGAWSCGATLELIQVYCVYRGDVRSRGPGGSPRWQPFCLLRAVPRAQFSAVPIHAALSGLWFHLLPDPRARGACDLWAGRRCFCLLLGGPEPGWTHLQGFVCIFHQAHKPWFSGSFRHHSHQPFGKLLS